MRKRIHRENPAKGRRGDLGSALIVTLLVSLFLAVIVGASMSRCLYTWNNIGVSYRHDCALHAAESGIEAALFAMNHQNPEDKLDYSDSGFEGEVKKLAGLDSVSSFSGSLTTPSGEVFGNYSSTVAFDPLIPERAIITSEGIIPKEDAYAPHHNKRTVRVVVHRTIIKPEIWKKAIYAEELLSVNGITEIHGDVTVGESMVGSENIDPASRVTQYPYEECLDFEADPPPTAIDYGTVDDGRNLDGDPENDVVLPFDEFILSCFKEKAIEQGYYFDTAPNDSQLPSTFFQPDGVTPNIVFITDTLKIIGNAQIGGLIFVVGDLYTDPEDISLGGKVDVDGIIYTTGAFRTLGGGNSSINLNGGAFGGAADLTGNAVVEYEWEYYKALHDLVIAANKFRFYSWQEILPEKDDPTNG